MHKLNAFEAARVIGCRPQEVAALLNGEPATLEAAERLALERYPWRAHVDNEESYWLTATQAADVLGLSVRRVRQLLEGEQVPYVVHRDGTQLHAPLAARDCGERSGGAPAQVTSADRRLSPLARLPPVVQREW